jgi:hypothetical protein
MKQSFSFLRTDDGTTIEFSPQPEIISPSFHFDGEIYSNVADADDLPPKKQHRLIISTDNGLIIAVNPL